MCAAPDVNGWLLRTCTSITPSTASGGVWNAFALRHASCHLRSTTAGSYPGASVMSMVCNLIPPEGAPDGTRTRIQRLLRPLLLMTIWTLSFRSATALCGDQVTGTRPSGGAGSNDLHAAVPPASTPSPSPVKLRTPGKCSTWLFEPKLEAGEDQVRAAGADALGVQMPQASDLERDLGDTVRLGDKTLRDHPQTLTWLDDVRGVGTAL